jgi:hypothetical protein
MSNLTSLVPVVAAGLVILGLMYTGVILIGRRLVGPKGYLIVGALCFGMFAFMMWPEIYREQPENTWSTLLAMTIVMLSWAVVPILLLRRLEAKMPNASIGRRLGHGVMGMWLATAAGFVAALPLVVLGLWLNW